MPDDDGHIDREPRTSGRLSSVPPSPAAELAQRLQDILSYPREDLDAEYKDWMDVTDPETRARIAKEMIALTNHGGGHLVFGYEESAGSWRPSTRPRPVDLAAFDQDSINNIIERYSEPAFNCEMHHVGHPESRLLFPIVRVPGGQRVPVRTKRACPCQKCVPSNVYYIRRPGPKSEAPQSGREWDELIRRCIRNSRAELLEEIRIILLGFPEARRGGGPQAPPVIGPSGPSGVAGLEGGPAAAAESAEREFDTWIKRCQDRFQEAIAKRLPEEVPSRYSNGVWFIAYSILGELRSPNSLEDLRRIVDRCERPETGWPLWVVLSKEPLRPYAYEDVLEALLVGGSLDDVGHSDFWRVSPKGRTFVLRGYQEDAIPELAPGKFFDVTLPIWRVAEALLHAERFAELLEAKSGPLLLRAKWSGLEGRQLTSISRPGLDTRRNRISRQDIVSSQITLPLASLSSSLFENVRAITRPVYEAFDLFTPSDALLEQELGRFRGTPPVLRTLK